MEGLQNLLNLKELYLSHNGIEVIEGLENNVSLRKSSDLVRKYCVKNGPCILLAVKNVLTCTQRGMPEQVCFVNTFCCSQKKLTTLDIAANRIKRIENISHLTDLQEFWVRAVCR